MVERDVVVAKIALIDRAMTRIRNVRGRKELEPIDAEELIILNLQRATQAAIDLAAHVVSYDLSVS